MAESLAFSDLFERVARPIDLASDGEYPLVGIRLKGQGAFLRETKPGLRIRKKRHYVIRDGDIIYNKLFAWRGAFAVVPRALDGCFVSDKFPTYRLRRRGVLLPYLSVLFRAEPLARMAERRSVGLAAMSKFTLNPPKFGELRCIVPDEGGQDSIVRVIAALDDNLSAVRRRTERTVRCLDALPSAIVEELCQGLPGRPLAELGQLTRRSITIQDDVTYRQLTIAMNNHGVRLRAETPGYAIAVKNQALVRGGDIVFSRIDIRNGAIGIVPQELDGAVVANDFPVFALGEELVPSFVQLAFRSKSFKEQCLARSAGSTNRRKMRRAEFLKLEIPTPPLTAQQDIASRAHAALAHLADMKARVSHVIEHMELVVQSLINQLVPPNVE